MRRLQKADGDALAMDRRHGGDADVVFALVDLDSGAAVLRQAALGDVELGQDLDARHRRLAEIGGQHARFHQHAVDPPPDDDAAPRRLDMEVGGARRRGFAEQAVDQVDDRRVERQVLEMLLVVVAAGGQRAGHRLFFGMAINQLFQAGEKLAVGGDAEIDRAFAGHLDRRQHGRVGRVGNGHRHRLGVLPDRQDMVLLHEAGRDRIAEDQRGWPVALVHHADAEMARQFGGQDLRVDQAIARQQPHRAFAGVTGTARQPGKLVGREEAPVEQTVEKRLQAGSPFGVSGTNRTTPVILVKTMAYMELPRLRRSFMTRLLLVSFASLFIAAGAFAQEMGMDTFVAKDGDSAATQGYKASMMTMMHMAPAFTGDADVDFMKQMKVHHLGGDRHGQGSCLKTARTRKRRSWPRTSSPPRKRKLLLSTNG